MTLSLERINKAREAGYKDDDIVESIYKKDQEFGKRIAKARESGYDNATILQSIEKRLKSNTPANDSNVKPLYNQKNDVKPDDVKPLYNDEIAQVDNDSIETGSKSVDVKPLYNEEKQNDKAGYLDYFKRGLQGSATGEISNIGGKTPEQVGQDPGFWESLVQESGNIVGDTPYLLAGATMGASLGGALGAPAGPFGAGTGALLGGGFGAFALPEFIKTALQEYRDFSEKGNDLTFGEFLQRADKVGSKTINAGLMGVILGQINRAAPLLKKIPGIGKLFDSKIAQKTASIAAETTAVAAIPPLSKGELPETKDFAHALALVLGFNALHLPGEIRDKLNEKGQKSGLSPEEYAKQMQVADIDYLAESLIKPKSAEHQDITKRDPEKVGKFERQIEKDLNLVTETAQDLPKGNKKNLALEAIKRGQVRTQDQLNLFLDEYEASYSSIPGKTGLSKNRKFLNRYSDKNTGTRNIKQIEGAEPIIDIKPKPDRVLELARLDKRKARLDGDKAKVKEAKKKVDMAKRKLEISQRKTNERPKELIEEVEIQKEEPKAETNQETEAPKESLNFNLDRGPLSEAQVKLAKPETIAVHHHPTNPVVMMKLGDHYEGIELTKEESSLLKKASEEHASDNPAEAKKLELQAKDKVIERVLDHQKRLEKDNVKPLYNEKKFTVNPKELSIDKPKVEKVPDPIIEVTGEGASERLQPLETRTSKIKEKASNALERVKNPTKLQHNLYTQAFDALEPINRLETDIPVAERVTTKIKQAQSAASDINNVLTKGIFDNVSNKFTSGSLKDVYTESGDLWKKVTKKLKDGEYSVEEMDIYRTSKEALKRQKRGLKSGIDTEIAKKDVERLNQKYGPVNQRLKEFQKNTLEAYGKDLLDAETRKQWSDQSHASLYRVMDYGKDAIVKEGSLAPKKPWHKAKGSGRKILPPSESDIQNVSMLVSNSKKNDSVVQYKKLVEQGKLPGRVIKSKNRAMPEEMMDDLEIDSDAYELAETLYNQSRKDAFTPETGRLRGWENGKAFEIEVPKDVYETYSSLAPSDTGMFTKIFRATNNLMSRGIVLEPRKFVSIVGRDALSSLIYSKTGSNPISIVRALADIYKDSHSWNQFKSLGGEQYASRLMTRTERAAKIEELIRSETKAQIIPFAKFGKFLSEFNSKLAASVPFAEYQRGVAKYGDTPNGRLQALIGAKEVSYDPTKKGSSRLVKDAANFFPFFNVMLQEPAMIAKNLKRPQFIAKGILGITLPSLLLKMYNEGNPDYDDMNPLLKTSCWHFYTGDKHFAVPVPWLLGATFKSAPEAFYDMVKGEGGDAWKGLYSYIASQLSGSFPPIVQAAVEQSTERSLLTPAGTILMPIASVEKRAPDVVPRRLQNLPPEKQFTSRTSQLARWYGDMWKVSPVKVDRLINTFGGGVAKDALALIDEIAYRTGIADDLRPEQGISNPLIFGNFVYNSTPSNTKYTNEFYSRLEESKIEKKRGNDNKNTILNSYNKKISQGFKKYRDIENQKIDPKRKKQLLQVQQKEINALYKEAVLKTN